MSQIALDIRDYFNRGTSSGATIPIRGSAYTDEYLFTFASSVLKNVYIIAGIVLLFFIVIGGMGMILNAGNAEKQKQGSKTVTSAVVGFLIMFASYWLIKIIEIITGTKIICLTC